MTEVEQINNLDRAEQAKAVALKTSRRAGRAALEIEPAALSVVERLRQDYPQLRFVVGKKFTFRPPRTVVFEQKMSFQDAASTKIVEDRGQTTNCYWLNILHEVGHALCEHKSYTTDPERLKMERAAWEKARELSEKYGVEYDEELVEAQLDTYRDWLHQRSKCASCGQTRYQTADGRYHCPRCEQFLYGA